MSDEEARIYPHMTSSRYSLSAGNMEEEYQRANNAVNQSLHLKSVGNLSYLDFIRTVQTLWAAAHPDIPIVPNHGDKAAQYPSIYYGLELRRTHPSEPKPRFRESINKGAAVMNEDGDIVLDKEGLWVYGWRFQNVVKFTVVNEIAGDGASDADEIMEVFEDFMHEYTPVFKYLGASEFRYNRRYADSEENRAGEDVVRRSVSFTLTTEKIYHRSIERIRRVAGTIRVDHGLNDHATPSGPSPYEPFYEEVVDDPSKHLIKGLFERISIIDDNQTIPPGE